ncbi:PAS domain S-box protein [candidate division WOR-3 bacterium]|nr:PAS domain S-box protein [candidate division WOR-3 bacterium]
MNKTVLIVEDENLISLKIKLVLEQNSYEVTDIVDSAEKALSLLEKQKPDIILLDILLSGEMDGIKAASLIKEKFGIPVVFLTAINDESLLEDISECGYYGIIYKPIEGEELIDAIEKALSQRNKDANPNQNNERLKRSSSPDDIFFAQKSFDLLNAILILVNSEGSILRLNSRAEEALGLLTEDISGKKIDSVFELKSSKSWKLPAKILDDLLDTGDIGLFSSFAEFNLHDSKYGVSKMSSVVKGSDGKTQFFILILEDKYFEEIVDNFYRISADRLKAMINNIGEGIGVVNGQEKFIFSNPAADRIFGVYPQSLIGRNLKSFLSTDQIQFVLDETQNRKSLKKTSYILEISRPDGEKRTLNVTATPETGSEGEYISSIGIFSDITEKIKGEMNLKEEQEKFKHLITGSRDIVYMIDTEGKIVFIGPQTKSYNIDPDEVVGKNLIEFVHPDDKERVMKEFEQVVKSGKSFPSEVRLVDKEGIVHWFEDYGNPTFDQKGDVTGQIGMLRDITERKKINNALNNALKEKEILLHEIHHRVRNNLEVISSLLQLQASSAGDERLSILLKETQSRVLSIGHVHGLLFHSQSYTSIEFSDFLEILTTENYMTFRKIINQLEIKKDLSKLTLSIDKAIPAGLIVNEIMINCLRHAFSGINNGILFISLKQVARTGANGIKKDFAQIILKDNGVGIPEGTDITNAKTLGMTIVKLLIKQLNGEISVKRDEGTEITVQFPL